jgi:CopG-like RHH_1 or ribbon-helix-helix domain, RHH_5
MPRSPRPKSDPRQARVNLTLTESIVLELGEWADQTGHTVTSLCTWLVKRSLAQAKKAGEFQPSGDSEHGGSIDIIRQFFDDVADGKYYSEKDLTKLAIEVEVSADHLIAYQECFKKKAENA